MSKPDSEAVNRADHNNIPYVDVPGRLEPLDPEFVETVNHPAHYGGEHNPYEVLKVIEAWQLGFHLGTVVKYIGRAGKKHNLLEDLKKAQFYLNRHIKNLEKEQG